LLSQFESSELIPDGGLDVGTCKPHVREDHGIKRLWVPHADLTEIDCDTRVTSWIPDVGRVDLSHRIILEEEEVGSSMSRH